MKFGFLYTDDGITVYDVTREVRGEMIVFVASLSATPSVNFAAYSEQEAVNQLKTFLYHRSMYNALYLSAPLPMAA